jgi:hypothetical protein
MSGHIWLTDNPDAVPLDRSKKTLWVYADKRPAPMADRVMPASVYLESPRQALIGVDLLVVVGMTDIVTPSNRVQTGPFLNEPLRHPRRESIDRTLFLSEPWRAWWHWGCVGARWRDVTHSFRLEGLWSQWLDARIDDPCSLSELMQVGADTIIAAPDAPRFGGLVVDVVEQPTDVHADYQREKSAAFEQETTWRGLVRRLGIFAQSVEHRRSVPTKAQLFRQLGKSQPHLVVTDLGVDRWLTEHYNYLTNLVDGVADHFQEPRLWTH